MSIAARRKNGRSKPRAAAALHAQFASPGRRLRGATRPPRSCSHLQTVSALPDPVL